MGVLKSAFNLLTSIHSRPVVLKRLGSATGVTIFSPARITPSNFFRTTQGPEYTTIKGSEFIIPVDSMLGEFAQTITLSAIPTIGTYTLTFGAFTTGPLNYNDSASTVQAAVRLLTGLANAIVTGSHTDKLFTIKFAGFDVAPALGTLNPDVDYNATAVFASLNIPWANQIKKGDRIVESNKIWIMDEPVEMYDLGATVMGWRVRCDVS